MSDREQARAKLAAAAAALEESAGMVYGIMSDKLSNARGLALGAMDGTNDGELMETLGYIDRAADMGEQMSTALAQAADAFRAQANRQ